MQSNYHLEVNPADANVADRFVIQELIKHVASSPSVSTVQSAKNSISFKTIVINEADKLTKDAQHALRRTMEKYMNKCRCILISKSTSRIIEPLCSRCLPLKCRAATDEELVETILPSVLNKEFSNNDIPEDILREILNQSNRDMRKFLLLLEAYKVKNDSRISAGLGDQDAKTFIAGLLPDWEIYIEKLANDIDRVQNVQEIKEIRTKLYELITHLIPTNVIFNALLKLFIKDKSLVLKQAIINSASKFEHRSRIGSKEIYHLEAFVVDYISMCKEYKQTGKITIEFD